MARRKGGYTNKDIHTKMGYPCAIDCYATEHELLCALWPSSTGLYIRHILHECIQLCLHNKVEKKEKKKKH